MKPVFSGCATALVTPMRNGAPDFSALEVMIEDQINGGVSALLPCGTTGEAPALSEEEKRMIVSFCVKCASGRVPVIAGCGSPSAEFAARLAAAAQREGASAVLAVTPYYNKASDEGVYLYYKTISSAVDIPVIAYNVPGRTGLSISDASYEKMQTIKNFAGVKEASGNVSRAAYLTSVFPNMPLYGGCDELMAPIYAAGGTGVVSVVSNILPGAVSRLCAICESGRLIDAAVLQKKLSPLIRSLFSDINPIPVKTALAMMGKCDAEMRLPLCAMSQDKQDALRLELANCGLL